MQVIKSKDAALTDLAAVVLLIATGKLHLYKDDGFVPDSSSTLADLNAHEADYTGYASQAIGAGLGPYDDEIDQVAESFPTLIFQPTGPVLVSNDIRGCYFEDTAHNLRQSWIFDAAQPMATVLDKILIDGKLFENFAAVTVEPSL